MSMMIVFSMMILLTKHPLSLSMILLSKTIVISMICGMNQKSFMMSYILFMIMAGGLLIIFIYMTSVASNEKFKLMNQMKMTFIFTMLLINMIYMSSNNNFMNMNYKSWPKMNLNIELSTSMYMNHPKSLLILLVIIYLLITMIAIIKIINIKKGPLRQMN